MTTRDIIRRSGRSLKSAKGRTILTALAIAVGTFALTLTLAASNGATAYVNKIINDNFDPSELIVTADPSLFGQANTTNPKEYDPSFGTGVSNSGATTQIKKITQADIDTIVKVEGVASIREDITVNARYITREGQKKYVTTIASFNPAQKPDLLAGELTSNFDGAKLILPEGFLQSLGFSSAENAIGKSVIVSIPKNFSPDQLKAQLLAGSFAQTPEQLAKSIQQNADNVVFTVAAVSKKPATSRPGTELYVYTSIDEARVLNDISTSGGADFRKYNSIYVKVTDGNKASNLNAAAGSIRDLGFQVRTVKETQEFLTNIIGVLRGIVAGFGLIAIIASVFGIVNTMYISVLQRTREIGLMKALGMRKRDIGRLFRFEAAWIGFLGGSIGSISAVVLGIALNPWITKQLNLSAGTKLLIFMPLQIIALIAILMAISIMAGWLPSRKAAKLDPIEALRVE